MAAADDQAAACFPRTARVRTGAEFTRVFESGRRHSHPLLNLHCLREGDTPRLGLAVSRKVDPRAVARNRIKRVIRDQFRRLRPQLTAGAYVVVARPAARDAAPAQLREAFAMLLQRAGALPLSQVPGTMPAAERPAAPLPSSMPRPGAG